MFTEDFKLPVYDTPQATRDNLRKAFDLFKQAGWTSRDGRLVNAKGEQFTIEFLGDDPSDERIIGPYIASLRKLGIDASIRIVDTSQYDEPRARFDFDIMVTVMGAVAVAGQRAARVLGLGRGRHRPARAT